MRGSIGSHVSLVVEREGEDSTEIQLVRSRIALNPWLQMRSPKRRKPIGYIRLVNSTLTPQ